MGSSTLSIELQRYRETYRRGTSVGTAEGTDVSLGTDENTNKSRGTDEPVRH